MDNPFLVEVTARPSCRVPPSRRGLGRRCRRRHGAVHRRRGAPRLPRSAVKALQALPLVESGIADSYRPHRRRDRARLRLPFGRAGACATAAAMLGQGRAGSSPAWNAAPIGPWPRRRAGRWRGRAKGRPRCTTIAPASMPGSSASPAGSTRGRAATSARHRVQEIVRGSLEDLTGASHTEDVRGIDGCSIPTYAMPLPALAFGFAKFGTGTGISRGCAEAAKRIRRRWRSIPSWWPARAGSTRR